MCGFTLVYTSINSEIVDKLNSSNKSMKYRGPDEEGIWSDENVAVGHVRLSILGLDNGLQPIESENCVLVCNGEIYNYLELKESLQEKGYLFKTESDSEVIIPLYKEYGLDFCNKLRGMFSFILYDKSNNKLIGARDPAGQKPFYYSNVKNRFICSSELKVLKEYFLDSEHLNRPVVDSIFSHTYSLSENETYIKEVRKLMPGHMIIVDSNEQLTVRYWAPARKRRLNVENDKTLDLIRESVDLHMRSDVPIAILLSGGVDSSCIAALAKEVRAEVHAITVGYKGRCHAVDEREFAKKLCKMKGIIWHEIELDEFDFQKNLGEFLSLMDEPNGDVSSFSQWSIYKKCKELGFKVLLNGNGADEIFFGYSAHNKYGAFLNFKEDFIKRFPFKKSNFTSNLKFILKNSSQIKSFLKEVSVKNNYSLFGEEEFEQTLAMEDYFNGSSAGLDKMYDFLFRIWLPNNCYHLSDKLGMGNSVEVRSPFSDHKLVEHVRSLPLEMLFDGSPKSYLKKILRGTVPDFILDSPKKGFTPPSSFVSRILDNYEWKKFGNIPKKNFALLTIDHYLNSISES